MLDTAVAHEMTHVFQRQYTTNLTFKWIDEAAANWGAWAILGSGADLNGDITCRRGLREHGAAQRLLHGLR